MEGLAYFKEMAPTLYNPEVKAWKDSGGRVIGTQCSNIPEEIIHAAGMLPIRLRAPGLPDTSRADSHLHRINCSYTRSVLEYLLRGEYDFMDGVVATNTCDHHLRLVSELEDKGRFTFFHYFQMIHSSTPGAREWFLLELKKLKQHLEEVFEMHISDADVKRSIFVYNRTRRLMAQLNDMRRQDPSPISGTEYMQIALTGMLIPREIFNDRLEALLAEMGKQPSDRGQSPRLLLLGGGCDSPEFVDFIESRGACVTADNMCYGLRHYMTFIDEEADDPLRAITDRYFDRIPCPSIIDGFDHGYSILRQIMKDANIDGVINARLKFCDHWNGYSVLLRGALQRDEDLDVPVLDLEREYNTAGSGQISTRVQAFLEMLNA